LQTLGPEVHSHESLECRKNHSTLHVTFLFVVYLTTYRRCNGYNKLQRMDKIKNESRRKRETVSVKKETIMLGITEKNTFS